MLLQAGSVLRVKGAVQARLCDCSECMRLHAAPMQWAAVFEKSDVRFAQESLAFLRWYNAKCDAVYTAGVDRVFPCKVQCTHCGTWIGDEGRDVFAAFPSLFDFVDGQSAPQFPRSFLPAYRIFCRTRALDAVDRLASFEDEGRTPASVADFLVAVAPRLDGRGHNAGAPYYAGMAALRVGAELLYLCTAEEACGPIKGYSPELMVSEVYRHSRMDCAETASAEKDRMVEKMVALLPRLHALVIGPGLGRHPAVLDAVARVVEAARETRLPLVVDADGLWLITQRPELVKGYTNAVLTPNVMEFGRLAKAILGDEHADLHAVARALAGPVVLQKGRVDRAAGPGEASPVECTEEGSPRRPGGLGDFLSGALAVILGWTVPAGMDKLRACQAASALVRRACKAAYVKHQRAMVAPDVLEEVGAAFASSARRREPPLLTSTARSRARAAAGAATDEAAADGRATRRSDGGGVAGAAGFAAQAEEREDEDVASFRDVLLRRSSDFVVRTNRPAGVSWDEVGIEKDMGERGVLYGTQTIDDAPTPFLLYDSHMSRAEGAVIEVGEGHVRQQVDIGDLQARLGVLHQRQEEGVEVHLKANKNVAIEEENCRRRENVAIEEENCRRREAGDLLKGDGDRRAALASRRAECHKGAAFAFKASLAKQAVADDEDEET
eukprot:CAMPEP_0177559442 /NCGR_PEP_ID=MMETSP0369-20130122/70838_1 /TAXON_ID=447022 ORGANISM="Scrippsiella hangoei-like, Strain SHHI-4" /NCGR_SAMPLE_ID=MMETSP0369 /ASSEMBLY_ACC=CAM_ASM_000364 /LENGTH=668 /DNA_ID=CAMNT_0019046171 /DNA_START=29 /DNA_END=2038 /DNA_ORIENTATION=+